MFPILHPGDPHSKGIVEKIADVFLYAPRAMWLGRSFEIIKAGSTNRFTETSQTSLHTSFCKFIQGGGGGLGPALVNLAAFLIYGFATLMLSVPLAIGVPLKKYAFHLDKKSSAYHSFIQNVMYARSKEKELSELNIKKDLIKRKLDETESEITPLTQQQLKASQPLDFEQGKLYQAKNALTKEFNGTIIKIQALEREIEALRQQIEEYVASYDTCLPLTDAQGSFVI